MKAYALHGIGDLRYEDRETPECPPGWAIVRVKAAGICSSDIPRIFTKGTYHFPTVPGHEFAGIVEAVGDVRDERWIGKHVGVFPLIPCGACPQCEAARYEMCENYDYIGSRRDGAFAELVAAPVWNLIEAPEKVLFEKLALSEPLAVALHAVKRAGEMNGRRAAVIGTGMIGIAAACWAKKRGAGQVRVYGRGEKKRGIVEQFGGIEYCGGDDAQTVSPADVVIEAVGTPESVEQAVRLTAPQGKLVLVGNPSGDIGLKQDVYWRLLRKQIQVCGTWNSSYNGKEASDWTEVLQALQAADFETEKLITHVFRQEELPQALEMMAGHRETYCKVMTKWND